MRRRRWGGAVRACFIDSPTLVLAGEYDPITPPSGGRLAAATLSRSSFFEIAAMGHGPLLETSQPTHFACARGIARAFLDDPTAALDGSCVGALPPPRFVGAAAADRRG